MPTHSRVPPANGQERADILIVDDLAEKHLAYQVVLDHMGVGDIHPELNRVSKQGKWLEMMRLISDDVLDQIGVSGTPAEVGARLAARNGGLADRTMLTMYNETGDPEAVRDVVAAFRAAERSDD